MQTRVFTLVLAAFALASSGMPAAGEEPPAWKTLVAYEAGAKLGGCVVGNVDPDHDGDEITAAAADGRILVIRKTGEGFTGEAVAKTPGEMIQVAVGELNGAAGSVEIVAVGVTEGGEGDPDAKGAAVLVSRHGKEWRQERIFEDTALLHGVGFGLGGVVVVGYSNTAHLLTRGPERTWKATKIADLPGAGKCVVRHGAGVAIGCHDGSVVVVSRTEDGFSAKTVDHRDAGRARIASRDGWILTSDDDATLSLVTEDGTTALHEESAKLRGAVLAELDPESPGLEAATAGYGKAITVVRRRGDAWRAEVVARDADRIHHLTSGRLPGIDRTVLVTCGYSGRVLVLVPPGP